MLNILKVEGALPRAVIGFVTLAGIASLLLHRFFKTKLKISVPAKEHINPQFSLTSHDDLGNAPTLLLPSHRELERMNRMGKQGKTDPEVAVDNELSIMKGKTIRKKVPGLRVGFYEDVLLKIENYQGGQLFPEPAIFFKPKIIDNRLPYNPRRNDSVLHEGHGLSDDYYRGMEFAESQKTSPL